MAAVVGVFDENIVTEKPDHSKLGASGAYLWMNCPGAPQLRDRLIQSGAIGGNTSSIDAARGTAAHDLASKCLELKQDAFEYIGQQVGPEHNQFTVDPNMADAVQKYLDLCFEKIRQYSAKGIVIVKVEWSMQSMLDEHAYGTGDFVLYVPGDRIIIIDYKHGVGVTVEPTSPQLKYYAYLAYENRPPEMMGDGEPKVIELIVSQPRAPHHKGPHRKLVSNAKEIETWWYSVLLPAMDDTRKEGALLNIGEWCRFCPNQKKCPALLSATQTITTEKPPAAMTEQELADLYIKIGPLEKFFDTVRAEMFERARNNKKLITSSGVQVAKLVKKQANRQWRPGAAEMIELELGAEVYTKPEFKSPAQVEQMDTDGAKRLVAEYAFSPDVGLTLAPMSDRREEVKPLMLRLVDAQQAAAAEAAAKKAS